MRVKIVDHISKDKSGMLSDLKPGTFLACDEATAAMLVDSGRAEYDFSHLVNINAPAVKVEAPAAIELAKPEVVIPEIADVQPEAEVPQIEEVIING